MTTRTILAAVSAAVIGLGLVAVSATAASAHVPAATLSCSKATVSLTNYDAPATAKITLDGAVLKDGAIGNTGTYTLDQALDTTKNHTLIVHVDSTQGTGGTEYDFDFNQTTTNCVPVAPPVEHKEVAIYIYKMIDTSKGPGWTNSGPQAFCESKTGDTWFTTYTCTLPPEVCGVDWAYQQDKVKYTEPATFTWPKTITYSASAPNQGDTIGWPPLYDAKHGKLSELVTVPPCDLPTHPLATPDPVTSTATCSGDGTYTIPTSEGVLWSIGGQPVQPGTYSAGAGTSVTVIAAPDAPKYGFAFDTQTQYPVSFPAASTCAQLATLASTGPTALQGQLVTYGLLLMVLGFGSIAWTMYRRNRDELI